MYVDKKSYGIYNASVNAYSFEREILSVNPPVHSSLIGSPEAFNKALLHLFTMSSGFESASK